MIKLSKLNTDQMLDKICELTPFLSSIVTDKKLIETFSEKVKSTEGEEKVNQFVATKIVKLVPLLFKDHKEDFLSILAIMKESTLEEVKNQPFTTTIKEVKELVTDKDLIDIFLSLQA